MTVRLLSRLCVLFGFFLPPLSFPNDLFDDVGLFSLGFVVGSHDKLRDKTGGNELNPGEGQHYPE